jgi:signal transduction histidine kinase
MSHEIRTPMTAILGFTDILLEDEAASAVERFEALRTIRRNGAYLLEILNDILDFSKIEANRLEIEQLPCSPRRITTDVAELLRPRAEAKGVALRVALDDTVPEKLLSDPVRLRQILLNLIGNAVKFTPKGGHVGISTRFTNRQVEVSVSDTGPGIPTENLNTIFEKFHQATLKNPEHIKGTGLGLAIVKHIITAHGGKVWAESDPGHGSSFIFVLPV